MKLHFSGIQKYHSTFSTKPPSPVRSRTNQTGRFTTNSCCLDREHQHEHHGLWANHTEGAQHTHVSDVWQVWASVWTQVLYTAQRSRAFQSQTAAFGGLWRCGLSKSGCIALMWDGYRVTAAGSQSDTCSCTKTSGTNSNCQFWDSEELKECTQSGRYRGQWCWLHRHVHWRRSVMRRSCCRPVQDAVLLTENVHLPNQLFRPQLSVLSCKTKTFSHFIKHTFQICFWVWPQWFHPIVAAEEGQHTGPDGAPEQRRAVGQTAQREVAQMLHQTCFQTSGFGFTIRSTLEEHGWGLTDQFDNVHHLQWKQAHPRLRP